MACLQDGQADIFLGQKDTTVNPLRGLAHLLWDSSSFTLIFSYRFELEIFDQRDDDKLKKKNNNTGQFS